MPGSIIQFQKPFCQVRAQEFRTNIALALAASAEMQGDFQANNERNA